MNNLARKIAASIVVALAPVVALLGYLLTSDDTPNPMPSHWDLHGKVDGATSADALVVGSVVAAALLACAAILVIWLVEGSGELMPAVLCYVAWLIGFGYLLIALVSRDAAQASSVRLPWYGVALMVAVPIVPAGLTWRLRPVGPATPVQVGTTTLSLGRDERVVWVGHAHSLPLRVLGLCGLAVAAALAVVAPFAAVVVGVVAVAMVAVSSLAVRVDDTGLHTWWGPLGWPRTIVRLPDVASAHAQEIEPLTWGGWGYRIGRHGVAAVVRRGPGLVVERREHPRYQPRPGGPRGSGS